MRINSFSNLSGNNYRKNDKNKKTSFGLPPKFEKLNLNDIMTIPTPSRVSQEALKAEIKLKESMKKYKEEYIEQINKTAQNTYKELQERENSSSIYDSGFSNHKND